MTFERACQFIFDVEGGYTDDPSDPGGETAYGISKRSYPNEDIPRLSRQRASEIYQKDYWTPCRCDLLPSGLDLLVFDCAVNQGTRKAILLLQAAAKTTEDGVIGPATMNAVRAMGRDAVWEYAALRMQSYAMIPQFTRYGVGWSRRLMRAVVLASNP